MTDERYFETARVADARSGATATGAALGWIPAIILSYAMVFSVLIDRWRLQGAVSEAEVAATSNPINQLFWILVLVITLLSARKRLGEVMRLLSDPVIALIAAYLFFAALSIAWSPVPAIALRRFALEAIVVASLVISTALADDREAMLDRVVGVAVGVVLVNLAMVVLTPPGPIGHEGIYTQKNSLGGAMSLSTMVLIYAASVKHGFRRFLYVCLIAAAFFALVMSRSKTSLGLTLLVPFLVLAVLLITRPIRMNAALFILFSLLFGVIGWFYISALTGFTFADLSMFLFNDQTFTGRTVIWQFALDVISRNPLIGQGYASFWGIGHGSIVEQEAPGFVATLLQAHSGYLDVLIETGMIGFAILVLLIFSALFAAARSVATRPALAWLSISLVLMALFHNTLESSWFRGYAGIWLMFVFAILLPRKSDVAPVAAPVHAARSAR